MLRRRRGQPLALDEALAILDAVCRGLQAVHSAGAVHGDLKPGNVLLGEANRVVVSDFGAARTIRDERAAADAVHGTPAYLAPEYGLSHTGPVEHPQRADLYSLGVMAYELLTGRLPFDTDDVLDMLHMHASRDPDAPSSVNPQLPSVFDAVLQKALAKQPGARQPSVQRFRQEINAARLQLSEAGPRRRFVVADDEPVFRLLGQTMLQAGFPNSRVVCVEDGLAAFDAIVAEDTAVALVDLDMPGLDGLALVEKLRADERGARVPIVVITGAGGEDDWKALTERGVSGFVVKPVDPDAVLALVRRLLHSSDM
jgi:serine/threonine-protein kinase